VCCVRSANGDVDNAVAIVFTNHDLGEYRRAASALGAQHFLDKLRDFDRLPDLLQQIRDEVDDGEAGECNKRTSNKFKPAQFA
jgi:hypothetical protein